MTQEPDRYHDLKEHVILLKEQLVNLKSDIMEIKQELKDHRHNSASKEKVDLIEKIVISLVLLLAGAVVAVFTRGGVS